MRVRRFTIHQGALKGRRFAYPSAANGHSCFTPSILKEAVFEILIRRILSANQQIADYAFFDLSAGSGQMGLEALSLGFQSIHLCEVDPSRVAHIKQQLDSALQNPALAQSMLPSGDRDRIQIYRRDFRRMLGLIRPYSYSVIYLDLPYSFWKQTKPSGLEHFCLQLGLETHGLPPLEANACAWIFIQGPRFFDPENIASARNVEHRRYGRQHLSFWRQNSVSK